MAIACSGERAPCLPSRMCSISSRTNSPAWVVGALPSRSSSRARSIVSFSGIVLVFFYLIRRRGDQRLSSFTCSSGWQASSERDRNHGAERQTHKHRDKASEVDDRPGADQQNRRQSNERIVDSDVNRPLRCFGSKLQNVVLG